MYASLSHHFHQLYKCLTSFLSNVFVWMYVCIIQTVTLEPLQKSSSPLSCESAFMYSWKSYFVLLRHCLPFASCLCHSSYFSSFLSISLFFSLSLLFLFFSFFIVSLFSFLPTHLLVRGNHLFEVHLLINSNQKTSIRIIKPVWRVLCRLPV